MAHFLALLDKGDGDEKYVAMGALLKMIDNDKENRDYLGRARQIWLATSSPPHFKLSFIELNGL
jgi:hypothetical protein